MQKKQNHAQNFTPMSPMAYANTANPIIFPEGDGLTPDTAFVISHPLQLFYIGINAKDCMDKHYILNHDLDLDPLIYGLWTPIGSELAPFTGSFNGNGYIIKNLQVEQEKEIGIGLFGYIEDAFLENIHLISPKIIGKHEVGGIAGSSWNSYLKACSVTWNADEVESKVQGNFAVGGLIGWNSGSYVERCYTQVPIYGQQDVGGLVGHNANLQEGNEEEEVTIVIQCWSESDIFLVSPSSLFSGIGGLIGLNEGLILESYAIGIIEGGHGLVGWEYGESQEQESFPWAKGYIKGPSHWNDEDKMIM